MADLSTVTTNFFPTPKEGFITTLATTILASAATVPLTTTSGLTNGAIFVGLIEPGQPNEQCFTGVVDTAGTQITSVKWTKGTNIGHNAGVTVVDYVTSTAIGMITKGLTTAIFDQDGTMKAGAVDNTAAMADSIVTRAKLASALTTEMNTDWKAGLLPAVSSVTENGNRSADITFASTVASILTPGMKLRTSRTVAAPTGAILLNGTTQYASKTTPSGMTFTDDFVVSAYVRLTSYLGTNMAIVSRYNGTSGWELRVDNTTGQIRLIGYNAGAANFSSVLSNQSIPLNKWVRIDAQLDMSTFTATTTTSFIMLDGVDVPCTVVRGGTNPTALVQAGDLTIGASNATTFFPGNIAQVAVFNAKVTQATLRGYKNQSFSGSEASIISAYKLDQASGLNDLAASANNLTATGSPTYSVASPFTTDATGTPAGTYDWAIVTKVATTVATVQYPEGCAIPTSGGISTVDYSGVKAPFGMPVDANRWYVAMLSRVNASQSAAVSNIYYNIGSNQLNVPVGKWILNVRAIVIHNSAALTASDLNVALSTSASSVTDTEASGYFNVSATGTTQYSNTFSLNSYGVSTTSATTYYLITATATASSSTLYNFGGNSATTIMALPSYL